MGQLNGFIDFKDIKQHRESYRNILNNFATFCQAGLPRIEELFFKEFNKIRSNKKTNVTVYLKYMVLYFSAHHKSFGQLYTEKAAKQVALYFDELQPLFILLSIQVFLKSSKPKLLLTLQDLHPWLDDKVIVPQDIVIQGSLIDENSFEFKQVTKFVHNMSNQIVTQYETIFMSKLSDLLGAIYQPGPMPETSSSQSDVSNPEFSQSQPDVPNAEINYSSHSQTDVHSPATDSSPSEIAVSSNSVANILSTLSSQTSASSQHSTSMERNKKARLKQKQVHKELHDLKQLLRNYFVGDYMTILQQGPQSQSAQSHNYYQPTANNNVMPQLNLSRDNYPQPVQPLQYMPYNNFPPSPNSNFSYPNSFVQPVPNNSMPLSQHNFLPPSHNSNPSYQSNSVPPLPNSPVPFSNSSYQPIPNNLSQPFQNNFTQPNQNNLSQRVPNNLTVPTQNNMSQSVTNNQSQPLQTNMYQPVPNNFLQPQNNYIPAVPNGLPGTSPNPVVQFPQDYVYRSEIDNLIAQHFKRHFANLNPSTITPRNHNIPKSKEVSSTQIDHSPNFMEPKKIVLIPNLNPLDKP